MLMVAKNKIRKEREHNMWCEGLDLEDWEDKYEDEVKKENKKIQKQKQNVENLIKNITLEKLFPQM